MSRAPLVRQCYQRMLDRTPGIAGTVVVMFSIDPEGTVAPLLHTARTADIPEEMAGCVRNTVHRLSFQATDAASEVSFPLSFSADL